MVMITNGDVEVKRGAVALEKGKHWIEWSCVKYCYS